MQADMISDANAEILVPQRVSSLDKSSLNEFSSMKRNAVHHLKTKVSIINKNGINNMISRRRNALINPRPPLFIKKNQDLHLDQD